MAIEDAQAERRRIARSRAKDKDREVAGILADARVNDSDKDVIRYCHEQIKSGIREDADVKLLTKTRDDRIHGCKRRTK